MDTTPTSTGMKNRHGGNGDSEDIKAGIEETRSHLDDTLDALSERLRPRHLLDDLLDYWHSRRSSGRGDGHKVKRAASHMKHQVTDSAGQAGRTVVRQVRAHPMPAVLIGAGIAWLLMERDHDEEYEYVYEDDHLEGGYAEYEEAGYGAIKPMPPGPGPESYALPQHYSEGEGGEGKIRQFKEKGAHLKERAGETWQKARRGTARRTEALRRRAGERGAEFKDQARHKYQQGVQTFKHTADEYPLAVGAGFLALGVLAGMLLPSTRKEDELVGPSRDRLVHRARDVAEDAVERGKHVARTAADTAKAELEAQGLTPEAIKQKSAHVMESAKSAAREEGVTPSSMKEKAQTAATHVKDATKEDAKRQQEELKHQV